MKMETLLINWYYSWIFFSKYAAFKKLKDVLFSFSLHRIKIQKIKNIEIFQILTIADKNLL
jgi:hypothetical protein